MGRPIFKAGRFVLGAGWLWLFSTGWGADWPVKKVKVERPAPAAVPEFKSGVSQKNLLKLSRPSPFGLPFPKLGTATAAVETLKILALRVEFQKEVPDDPATTGLGVFDRRTQAEFVAQEGHLVDPAPHTKEYFESHLQALDRFYQAVSNGRLKLIGEIWPPVDDSAYQLPVPQAYYGSGGPYADSAVVVQISRFFQDAVRLADATSPQIDFSTYQSLVIFHAGSDRQDDIFANSPNDFFTGFLRLGESDFVLVDGGTDTVTEGMVVPESPSQDNRIVGLNATLAHEFGHQLGLVDLYNTQTLITQVGDFSMMDNNGADVAFELDFRPDGGRIVLASSLLPVYPDAWSRAFLGFLDTLVVTRGPANLSLFAAELQQSGVEAVKVPISDQEYFLIENRAIELDGFPPALKIDSTTYVVLGPGRQVTINSSVFTFEYDLLLPGSGILIWHVDEGVALQVGCADEQGNLYSNYSCNTVNVNPLRRFLELKEADGFVDFGGDYYTGAFGFAEDMYWVPNNTAFTPSSNPSSRSKFGGQTSISVTGIGPPDTLMSFSVSSDYLLAGWPQFTGLSSLDWPVILGDLDEDMEEEILTFSGPFLLVWIQSGSKFIPNLIQGIKPAFDKEGTSRFFPLAVFGATNPSFGNFSESFTAGPAGGNLNGIAGLEVAAGTGNGRVFVFNSFDEDGDPVGLADPLVGFPVDLDSSAITVLLIGKIDTFPSPMIFAGTSLGKGFLISGSGVRLDSNQFQGSVIGAALDSSGNLFVTTARNDSVFVCRSIDTVVGWPKRFVADTISAPALAESDSGLWLAFTTGDTTRDIMGNKRLYLKLYLLDGNGNTVSGFPVDSGITNSADLSQPVWSHSSTAGQPVILLAFDNKILAYQTNGVMVTDFPKSIDRQRPDNGAFPFLANRVLRENGSDMLCALPSGNLYFPKTLEREASFVLGTGAGIEAVPAVTNNGKIFARDVGGFLYGYSVAGFSFDSLAWRQARRDFAGTNFLPKVSLPGSGGGTLVAEKSFYNYPNPVVGGKTTLRYRLSAPATATLTVYDMAGNRIKEPQFVPAEVGNDNEVQLDCSGFAAGVYLCRLEVNASGKKEVVFCKVAVVK